MSVIYVSYVNSTYRAFCSYCGKLLSTGKTIREMKLDFKECPGCRRIFESPEEKYKSALDN